MILILGALAISTVMAPASIVTGPLAPVTVAGRAASVAVAQPEESTQPPKFSAGYSRFPAGQKNEQKAPQSLDQWPMECEGAATRLDFAVIDTQKLEGAYLIIIARLGTGEFSRSLNQTRLANAKEYVLRRGSALKYVLAEGSRVKGLGRLELYVGGQLAETLPLRKNAKGYCVPGRG